MKVKKILKRLASAPESEGELSRAARALANELSKQRLPVLRDFRAGLAKLRMEADTQVGLYAAGYMASMLDITAEYEVFLGDIEDSQEVTRVALREDWQEVLGLLQDGPKLPSDLAGRMGKDRPTVTRILKRMRTAGLIESFASESLDGRMRPHRMTLRGRQLFQKLDTKGNNLSDDMARGIALAVRFFQKLSEQPETTAQELGELANSMLPQAPSASDAVHIWAKETKRVGLRAGLIDTSDNAAQVPASTKAPGSVAAPAERSAKDAANSISDRALWRRIPAILSDLEQYKERDTPVFVRTSDGTWGAWAYALGGDSTGMSRTIVKGDILAHSLTPPDRRFALVYDNPEAIDADRQEPAMQAFLERAADKFVIAASGDAIPEGFIALSPHELAEEE